MKKACKVYLPTYCWWYIKRYSH